MTSRPWGQYALCLLLIVGSLICHGIIIASNAAFGFGLGDGNPVYGWAMAVLGVGVDVVGIAALSAYAGVLYRDGEKWNARGVRCLVVFFMAYSMIAWYGFSAAHRMEPTVHAQRQHDADVSAVANANVTMDGIRRDTIGILAKQSDNILAIARDTKNTSKTERAAAAEQAKDARSALLNAGFRTVDIKAAPVFTDPDPQAKVLSDDTGLSVLAVQKIMTAFAGFAAMLLSSVGTTAGVRKWPKWVKPVAAPRSEPVSLEETFDLPVHENKYKSVERVAKLMTPDILQFKDATDQIDARVRRFLAEATKSLPGASLHPKLFHEHFCAWASLRNEKTLASRDLGSALMRLEGRGDPVAPKRVYIGKGNFYLDRMLVNVAGMVAA